MNVKCFAGLARSLIFRRAVLRPALLVMLALLSAPAAWVSAQVGGGFTLAWSTVDGGGGTATGGAFSLQGTIGQPDAGTQAGGVFSLQGGFWGGSLDAPTSTATPTG